ncbi:MAG: YmdB family metallophosphoesterase [Ruminococcaceae bacterium]|nr:YmdB family metallophosphoesterase [Oscillospiraceae bacterium]
MKILAIGDVVGEQTLPYLRRALPAARQAYAADLVIANGENVCDVHGLSPLTAQALFDAGVDFITSGNHIFDRRDAHQMLEDATRIIRPCNYPAECPGEGSKLITSQDGWQILVVNVSGVAFMDALGNPYTSVEYELSRHRGRYDLAVLDIHAEATSEKIALARYFDGRFAVIFGTHTHVQTNDAQILPKGTGYLTDLGMTGPVNGILGVKAEDVIYRARTHLPRRFTVADGPIAACGALFEVNPSTGKCLAAKPVKF